MKPGQQIPESVGLDEVLEQRLRDLLNRIGNVPLEDLEAELNTLSKLVEDYKRRDELLEGLLDPKTTEVKRRQIIESLKSQKFRLAQGRAENAVLQENAVLHEKSHRLIETSIRQLLEAARRLHRRNDELSEYAPEICGYCNGFGRVNGTPCQACDGKRIVLVHQPPIPCPRCNGNGKPIARDRETFFQDVCVVCRGKGWALVIDSDSPIPPPELKH